ncbi:MAG: FtsW/RodA/SpoVE family cell cycle protein [Mollicutes bacterium]|nr:FtsW/RodA/SpoVE family cell cycle protein [Mollicutes bacterium]
MITLLVILGGLSFLVFKNDFLKGFQKERFNYKQPCLRYVERSGYQLCNSFIAINNGGLFGSGLGNSTQKYLYLPAGHTDFIFVIILEELGSIVGVLIIIAYIYMLYRIVKIAKSTSNLRNSIIAFGTFIIISVHILINLAGILGLIPLTGVPLPFLSYGGSFTIVTYMLIFLVQRVAVENNQSKHAKELKRL